MIRPAPSRPSPNYGSFRSSFTCRRGLSPFALITTKALSASSESAVANPRAQATPAVSSILRNIVRAKHLKHSRLPRNEHKSQYWPCDASTIHDEPDLLREPQPYSPRPT